MTAVDHETVNAPAVAGDSATKSPAELKAYGYSQLTQGKRHLLVADIPQAVSTLALACDVLSKQFGETDHECAEAYLYYGKALLEMSRLESGVLGNALEGVPEGGDAGNDSQVEDPEKMTTEERTEVGAKVKEALDFNYQTCEVEAAKAEEEAAKEEMDADDNDEAADGDEDVEAMDEDVETSPVDEVAEVKNTNADDSSIEDEPSNLQLAWEMLELAKIIYTKHVDTLQEDKRLEDEKKVCEAYLLLGEVSIENENYQQAVEDLGVCLTRRQVSLPADSRSIAETHYQLGVAHASSGEFEKAESSMKNAMSVLETRVANLQKIESSDYLRKEVEELNELIKEIKEVIVDHKSMKAESSKKIKLDFSANTDSSGSEKVVSNIAVKRKEDVNISNKSNDTAAAAM